MIGDSYLHSVLDKAVLALAALPDMARSLTRIAAALERFNEAAICDNVGTKIDPVTHNRIPDPDKTWRTVDICIGGNLNVNVSE